MREMVMTTIADQPDIEIVGEVTNESDLNDIVEQTQPDVLILTLEEPEEPLGRSGFLLGRYPRMRIVALAPEKNRGIYYWAMVEIRNKPVESSEAGVLSAIRERPAVVGLVRH